MKNILIWVGSNSSTSINKNFANYFGNLLHADTTVVTMSDLEFPFYSPDLEKKAGIPNDVKDFYDVINSSDGIVIASPEYNGLMPGAFKNALDWISRVDQRYFKDKPVVLLSTSPGKNGGKSNLDILGRLLPFAGARIVGQFSLGNYYDHVKNGEMNLSNEMVAIKQIAYNFIGKSKAA